MRIAHIFLKIIISVGIGSFLLAGQINAQTDLKIRKSTINPGSFLYPLDRALEKLFQYFQFTPALRVNYYKSLLEERLAEVDYVAKNKLLGEVEKSSNRFAAQAGVLTDYVNTSGMEEEKQTIVDMFQKYADFLPQSRDKFQADTSFWRFIQQDIDSLNLYLDKLK